MSQAPATLTLPTRSLAPNPILGRGVSRRPVSPGVRQETPAQMSRSALEQGVGMLIRAYIRQRSPELALGVVRQLDLVCQHPDLRDPELLCAYRRLRRHWCWLAEQATESRAGAWGSTEETVDRHSGESRNPVN